MRIDILLFFVYNLIDHSSYCMDKERLKLIVKNLDLLLQSLKEELNFEEKEKNTYKEISSYIDEYEPEYYEEED